MHRRMTYHRSLFPVKLTIYEEPHVGLGQVTLETAEPKGCLSFEAWSNQTSHSRLDPSTSVFDDIEPDDVPFKAASRISIDIGRSAATLRTCIT
jgi:hypothetical protein